MDWGKFQGCGMRITGSRIRPKGASGFLFKQGPDAVGHGKKIAYIPSTDWGFWPPPRSVCHCSCMV